MSTANQMRLGFDQTFAVPLAAKSGARIDLLAVTVGGDPFAIRLAEISGLFADRPLTPAPSGSPAFLGVVGVRSAIIAVFDLAALLGYPRAASARWFVVSEQLGFAFERLESHLRVPASAIARDGSSEVVTTGGLSRPIMNLASVIATVTVTKKER